MNTLVLEENQNALDAFEQSILGFVAPSIFDDRKEQAIQLDKTLSFGKDIFKEKKSWLRQSHSHPKYDIYKTFTKRYEKLQNRIKDFGAKFAQNQISATLQNVKDSLTHSFEAKANLNATAHSLSSKNFLADVHAKSVLVESKFQHGELSAEKAYEHIDKIQNTYENNPLKAENPMLAKLIASYKNNYASQSIFKNDGGTYDFENILSEQSVSLLKADNEEISLINKTLAEQKKKLFSLHKKFNIAKLNNLLVDAQKHLALVGEPNFDESEAEKVLDKLEIEITDFEKLQTKIEVCESEVYELNTLLETKEEKSKHTAEEISKIEAKERLNKLVPKIEESIKLAEGKTPTEMLNQHYMYLNNELAEIEKTLTLGASTDIMQRLNFAKSNLQRLNTTISQIEVQNTQAKVLEYTLTPPTNDDDKNKK